MANPEQNPNWPFRPGFTIDKLCEDSVRIADRLPEPNWHNVIASALIDKANRELRTQPFRASFYATDEGKALFGYRTALVELLSEPIYFTDTPRTIRTELLGDVADEKGNPITPYTELEHTRTFNDVFSSTEPLSLHVINANALRHHIKPGSSISKTSVTIYMHGGQPDNIPNVPQAVLEATGRPTLMGRIQALHDYNLVAHELKDRGIIARAA